MKIFNFLHRPILLFLFCLSLLLLLSFSIAIQDLNLLLQNIHFRYFGLTFSISFFFFLLVLVLINGYRLAGFLFKALFSRKLAMLRCTNQNERGRGWAFIFLAISNSRFTVFSANCSGNTCGMALHCLALAYNVSSEYYTVFFFILMQ